MESYKYDHLHKVAFVIMMQSANGLDISLFDPTKKNLARLIKNKVRACD